MSDVMAIVSKAVFEKAAGKTPSLGTVLGMDRYISANKGLTPLDGGGTLYLVTVRPPDEALWLVAVLENPQFSSGEWVAAACTTPLLDISALKSQLVFENGKGLPTNKGTLGMSLQTPRVLTAQDVALLAAQLGGAPAPTQPVTKPRAPASDPLLAAVLAAPTDDAARRALAAQWTADNEPRGELVTVDLALRDRVSVPTRKALTARRAELIAAHAKRWWPYEVLRYRQRGGMLTYVRAGANELLEIAPTLFAREPITEVEVIGADEESIAQLAKAPWLARLHALAVHGEIGDEGFAALVKSKHAQNLTALNVSGSGISGEGLAALKSSLPALHRLCLTNNPIGDDGCAALAAWKHLGTLRTLYLSACEITDEGIAALAGSGKLTSLEKLTLGSNEELSSEGLAPLASTRVLPNLRYLELKNLQLDDTLGSALAAAKFPHMRHLDLGGAWDIDRDALRAVYRTAVTG